MGIEGKVPPARSVPDSALGKAISVRAVRSSATSQRSLCTSPGPPAVTDLGRHAVHSRTRGESGARSKQLATQAVGIALGSATLGPGGHGEAAVGKATLGPAGLEEAVEVASLVGRVRLARATWREWVEEATAQPKSLSSTNWLKILKTAMRFCSAARLTMSSANWHGAVNIRI